MKRQLLLVLALLFAQQLFSHTESHFAAIKDLVSHYKRPYTVLEISRESCECLMSLTASSRCYGIAMLLQADPNDFISQVEVTRLTRLSVLAPPKLSLGMLEMLGRCEHFDVVIVDDISSVVPSSFSRLIDALSNLGDHVFMFAESQSYVEALEQNKKIKKIGSDGGSLFLSDTPKKGLDIARYTQKKEPSKKGPRYPITSTFRKKEFTKKGLKYPIKWLPGINLVTFTMLYGVYPNDMHIRREIRRLKKTFSEHNDFVIGNILLQGNKLIPIDFSDSRRNADFYDCVEAALTAFKRGNTRLDDPREWIDEYYQDVP